MFYDNAEGQRIIMKYKKIERYKNLDSLTAIEKIRKYAEMSEYDLSFLLGALKKKRPGKLLEIGVASGGTSVAILNFLQSEEIQCDYYAVDLSKTLYWDNTKKTGFLTEEFTMTNENMNYSLFTGHTVAYYIDQIGSQIDFVLIDTMHSMPGELLDFLAIYPFLSKHTTVVLHDVCLNHLGRNRQSFATRVLFDTVTTCDKYYSIDDIKEGLPVNIAAFSPDDDTRKYIIDVFSALSITWSYIPEDWILNEYRSTYEKFYDASCLELYDQAVEMNKKTRFRYENLVKEHYNGNIRVLLEKVKHADNVYIYGCGNLGRHYYEFLRDNYLMVTGMVVSDDQTIPEYSNRYYQVPIVHLSELTAMPNDAFIIASGEPDYTVMVENLLGRGYYNIL